MNRVQIQMIKEALEIDHLLNEWEIGFINDIAEKGGDYNLSKKEQHNLLFLFFVNCTGNNVTLDGSII